MLRTYKMIDGMMSSLMALVLKAFILHLIMLLA